LNFCRLDNKWWLPAFFDYRYPIHVELVLTHACSKSDWLPCLVCDVLPAKEAKEQFDTKHYLTYSVTREQNRVFRTTDRNIVAPHVFPENDEFWSYWKIPLDAEQVALAFRFLESQIGKPFHAGYNLNFFYLCRRKGVMLDSDYWAATHWYCSELAAATLLLCCPAFEERNLRDPCLVSPCVLEALVRDLPGMLPVESEVGCIPPIRSVRSTK